MPVGKLIKTPLREIWKNEARDFTSWLAENIDTLNEVLDTNFSVIEREKKVGDFSLDLVVEDADGQLTIIENQLEKTDHDHLGKVLTYLTNLDAKNAVWISSNPREEHVKVINWLNENTPDDVSFYLIKIEAVRIGQSDHAPLFSIVAEPTDVAKEIGKEKKEYAERHHLRKEFWQQLLEKAKSRTRLHSNCSPSIYNWISSGSGRSGLTFNYAISYNYVACELYIDKGKDQRDLNKKIFDDFYAHKTEIERAFGSQLTWERLDKRRASRIVVKYTEYGLHDKGKWDDAQNVMIDTMIRLEKALKEYINNIK